MNRGSGQGRDAGAGKDQADAAAGGWMQRAMREMDFETGKRKLHGDTPVWLVRNYGYID